MFKRKTIIPILILLAAIASACAPQAAPTLSAADSQNTAVAAAWTMVAATQLAQPTATLLPPTPEPSATPMPTFTPFLLPTPTFASDPFALPTATAQAAKPINPEDCTAIFLNMGEAGPTSLVTISNETAGSARVSLTMYSKNGFGQCGAVNAITVASNSTASKSLPGGSWFVYAWITLPNNKGSESGGSFSLPDNGKGGAQVTIREAGIIVR